ncbi:MAG: ParB/RepB/Spo0J family partition protein, partial [Pigmentiphaga sp.]
MMNIEQIELSKLILSERYQARKTRGQQPLESLADSIHAQGLLQNLNVIRAKKRGMYEVVAGGRRLQAMQLLLADGRWTDDITVPVRVVSDDTALEVSLAENIQREAMHPADEFMAFAALINQGNSLEDIAARFGVTTNVVRQRMKLAAVAPELIQAYRDKELSLENLMAFTVTDDQQRQLEVWEGFDSHERTYVNAHRIRAMLKDQAFKGSHPLVKFVGLEAYRAAGGKIEHDLFAANGDPDGIYIENAEIIQRLATEKLQTEAQRLGQGWSWADFALSYNEAPWAGYSNKFGRAYAEDREMTKAEAAKLKSLSKSIEEIEAQMQDLEGHYDNDDDDSIEQWNKLDEQLTNLQEERAEFQASMRDWPKEAKAIAGVGLYIDGNGELNVTYGLIRPEDRRAAIEASNNDDSGGESPLRTSLPPPATRPQHSERLVRQLTAHKVGIVSADLAEKPTVALAVLVAQLAMDVLGQRWKKGFGLGISLKNEYPQQHAPDFVGSKAHQTMKAL